MSALDDLRSRLDAVDDELVSLLNRRFALQREMRALKVRENLPRVDATRETAIISRVLDNADPAERDTVAQVFETIFGSSRGLVETIARGVAVRDGKVLLCRAKGGKSTYLPGGHIEFGETAREALVREVREETGLASTAGRFLGVVENAFDQHGKRHAEINLVYALELASDAPETVMACEDWIEFEWCPLDALASANLLPREMEEYVRL